MILLILPFIAYGLKQSPKQLDFRLPGCFTLVTFLLYASEIVPNFYVEGSIRGQRMADIFYYEYYIFLMINLIYWIGYFQTKHIQIPDKIKNIPRKYPLAYFAVLALCILTVFGIKNLRQSSSYRAVVWLTKGYAAEYKSAWEERLEKLNDPSLREVYFEPIEVYHELVFYADLEPSPDSWLNTVCAEYYGKDAIGLIEHEK